MWVVPAAGKADNCLTLMMRHLLPIGAILTALAPLTFAQLINPAPLCAVVSKDATYPAVPLQYPMTSDRYAVQYMLGTGAWTDARVYISYYGGTNATPFRSSSGYAPDTSMSFAGITAAPSAALAIRVTKLWGSPFPAINHVSVRPQPKGIHVDSVSGMTVQLSTTTAANFNGDQFLLWWDGNAQQSSSIQGLVFFLNPPYVKPTGSNVKVVAAPGDLNGDLSPFDTLDFEGTVAIGSIGAKAFLVPTNITRIYLAPGAWVQGKLRFVQGGQGSVRRVYGPGVLDVSRFEYDLRSCDDSSGYGDQGYEALSWVDPPKNGVPDQFQLDGIVITDHNHATTDLLVNSSVNNVNSIGWNGLNGGFRIGQNTTVSNLFIRAGDDSLMMWGDFITVTNATVWQTYNGAVVNLGWGQNSPGDYGLIDGLYVVKTDWNSPTQPSWSATNLNGQNNAVIASLMVPGTTFGTVQPSLFRNIYVEDPPQTLLSLKILFPECNDPNGPRDNDCVSVNLMTPSVLNLDIENLSSPPSVVGNSIGFQTLPPGFALDSQTFPSGYTLTGSMNISLNNVTLRSTNGSATTLTSGNAGTVGKLATNGANVNQLFGPLTGGEPPRLTNQNAAGYGTALAPEDDVLYAQAPEYCACAAGYDGRLADATGWRHDLGCGRQRATAGGADLLCFADGGGLSDSRGDGGGRRSNLVDDLLRGGLHGACDGHRDLAGPVLRGLYGVGRGGRPVDPGGGRRGANPWLLPFQHKDRWRPPRWIWVPARIRFSCHSTAPASAAMRGKRRPRWAA